MPSITAGIPGGSRAGFTSAGVVLHVRNVAGFQRGLQSAGKTLNYFGRQLQLGAMTQGQRNVAKFQAGLGQLSNTLLAVTGAAVAIGSAIGIGIGAAALRTASNVQQLNFALQGLVAIELGKEQESKGLIIDMSKAMQDAIPVADDLTMALRDVALQSPIQYEQVFSALRLQLAYGATATATVEFTEKIKEFGLSLQKAESPALSMAEAVSQVGAVLARDSATFERLNYNLAQAILKGDLTAKNLRELKNAGLSLEDVFESELNMTLEETRAALKAGEIATEDLQVAFISFADRYFKPAAERMTQSLQGITNNFRDLWAFAATDLMTPMIEQITIRLNEWFDSAERLLLSGHFERIGEQIGDATIKVLDFVDAIGYVELAWAKTAIQTVAFATGLVVISGQVAILLPKIVNLVNTIRLVGMVSQDAGVGIVGAISQIVNPVTLAVGAFAALAVGIFAIVKAHKNHQEALDKEAASLVTSTDYYGEYEDQIRQAGLETRQLTRDVYDLIKAREKEGLVADTETIVEAKEDIEDFGVAVTLAADEYVQWGVAQDEATVPILELSKWVNEAIRNLDEMSLILLTNANAVEDLAAKTNLEGQALRYFIAITKNSVKNRLKEIDLTREASNSYDEITKRYEEHVDGLDDVTDANRAAIQAEEEQKDTLKDLEDVLEEITEMYEDWGNALTDAVGGMVDADQTMADVHADFQEEMADINKDLADDLKDIEDKFDDMYPEATSVEKRLGQVEDVWDEWALRMAAIQEVGGPEEDLEAEGSWLAQIQQMTEGTDFALREGVENTQGWMMRLKQAFYEGQLPKDFYNEDSALYQDWLAKKEAAQEAATAKANAEAAERRRIAREEREAAQAEAEQERQDAIIQGALSLAESSTALEQWAQATQGPMWQAYDTADEVFEALQKGTLELTPELQALITNYAGGLIAVSGTAKGEADKTKKALGDVITEATGLGAQIPALQAEYERLKDSIGWTTGGEGGRGGMSGLGASLVSEEDKQAAITRMQEIQTQLEALGITAGAEFPTVADDMKAGIDATTQGLIDGLAGLDEQNQATALGMITAVGGVATAWADAMFGNSVVPDTEEAMTQSQTAWDGLMTHMTTTMGTLIGTVSSNWKTGADTLIAEVNRIADAVTNLKDRINEIPTEVTVTITIKTETSPAAPLSHGIKKVEHLLELFQELEKHWTTRVSIDLPNVERLGTQFGNQLVASISAVSSGGKGTAGRWWDFTKNLLEVAGNLGGLAGFFGGIVEEEGFGAIQNRISEIDKLISETTLTEAEHNKLLEERNRLTEEQIRQQETLDRLATARADLEFLEKQVALLELIRNNKLNAKEILQGITLGIDASAAELTEVTTRALEALVQQINNQLKIASPSGVMTEVGKRMMEGMGMGIAQAAAIPLQATQQQVIAPIVGAAAGTTNINLNMNPTIHTGMDQVVFENRVLDIIRRGARGY